MNEKMTSSMIEELFQQQKESFIKSLERSISVISSDQILNQLFKDKQSTMYIPDRIKELIYQCIHDEREDYILQIFSKLRAIEACFGPKLSIEIEEIGSKILSIPTTSSEYEIKRRICLQKLEIQLKSILSEYFPTTSINQKPKLKQNILLIKNSLNSLTSSVNNFKDQIQTNFLFLKTQVNNKILVNTLKSNNSQKSISNNELDILQHENMTLKALIQVQNQTKSNEKEAEIEKLKRSLREYRTKVDDLIQENKTSQDNLNRTVEKFNKIKNFAKTNYDTSGFSENFDHDFDEMDVLYILKKLKKDNQFAQTEITKLKQQNEQLSNENFEFRSQSTFLTASVSEQNKNLEEKSNLTQRLEIENKQLKGVNSQLLAASKNLQQQNKEALEQVETLKNENASLKRKLSLLAKKIRINENERSNLQSQILSLSTINEKSKTDTDIFKETTSKEIQRLKTENQNLTIENSKLNSMVESFKENSALNKTELSKKTEINSKLSNENFQLNSHIQIIQNKLNSIESNKEVTDEKIQLLQTKIYQLENENKILKNENQDLNSIHKKTLSNCSELKDAVNTLTDLNNKLTLQNNDLSLINESSKSDKKMISTYKEQLEKLQEEYTYLIGQVSKLKQENLSLNSAMTEIRGYKEKIEKLTSENNELQNISQQMKKEMKFLETTIDEKERKISDLNLEKTKIESKLRESEDKLYSVQSVNGLLGTKGDQIITLASHNQSLKQSIQSSENNLANITEANKKLVKALQKSKSKIESLKHDLIKVLSVNEELVNKNQTLLEIKRRVTNLSDSKTRFSSSFSNIANSDYEELDKIQKISDTIHSLKQENKDKSKTLVKNEIFQKRIFNLTNAQSEKEAERFIEQIIKKQKEYSLILTRIREVLNINQTDNILIILKDKLTKLNNYIEKEKKLRKTLKINDIDDDDEEAPSETLKAILLLKAKAENNENLSSHQSEINNSTLKRLCIILSTPEISKLPISVQSIQEQINDARIKFKQLRVALDITNDDEIVEAVQSLVLKLKEEEENLLKIRKTLKCSNDDQLSKEAFDSKSKANIINEIKSLMKVDKDDEITQSIQRLLTFQNKIKSSVQINNNNSEVNPISVFDTNNFDEDLQKLRQIQENENILSQMCLILKNDNKNELPLIIQNIKNYIDQILTLIHINSYDQIIPCITKLINENSQIDNLQTKISEKSQKVSQMKKMMQSLESQVTEMSSFSNEKKSQLESTSEEIENLQSSLKSTTRKVKSLMSKIEKKNELISSLKQSVLTLRKENETISNLKSNLDTSINETQNQIKRIESDLQIESINKVPELVTNLRNQLSSFSEDPFKNESEMKRINIFKSCLKEISSLLISTDIQNFAKEIEEMKEQIEEFTRLKNHLAFTLSLRSNESLTGKIDEIIKEVNDSQQIFGKVCLLLNVPSKEDVPSAVSSIITEVKEMKSQARILQSAASANSQQTLLKSIKTMKQSFSNFVERYNLNDENELSIIDDIMKNCEVESLYELQKKIKVMAESTSTLENVQKNLKMTSIKEVNSTIKKNQIYDKIKDLIKLNDNTKYVFNDSSSDTSLDNIETDFVLKNINELIKMRITLERILDVQQEDILNKVTNLIQFKNSVIQSLNANDWNDVEKMIQRLFQFEEHEEEIRKILNVSNPTQINDELRSLIQIAKNQKNLMKFFNAENDSQLMEAVSQLSQDNNPKWKAHQMQDMNEETDIQLQIQDFIKREKKICKILCLNDPVLILSRISALKSINDKLVEMFNTTDILTASQNALEILNNICSILHYEKVTMMMINSSASSTQQSGYQSQLSQESELRFNGLDKAVEKLNNDYSIAVTFFSKIFAILSGQEQSINNIIIQFPLSSNFEEKIISSLKELKERNEQCQIVLTKANVLGFSGQNCVEAVDYLLSHNKNQDKIIYQSESNEKTNKLQEEIIREKKKWEIEQQELKKTIMELQKRNNEMSEKEEEMNKKLRKEKKKREMMNLNLQKEKEVNQSLVTILHGNSPYSTDSSINKSVQ